MKESATPRLSQAAGQAAVGPYIGIGLGGLVSTLIVGVMILVSLAGTQVNPAAFAAPEAIKGLPVWSVASFHLTCRASFWARRSG